MKSHDNRKTSITKPILKELKEQQKKDSKQNETPSIGSKPLQPPALYEDAGEGYSSDFTFPQT